MQTSFCRKTISKDDPGTGCPIADGISHRLTGPDRTSASVCQTPGMTLTCRYGFRRTDRTPSNDLRIKWSGGPEPSELTATVTATAVETSRPRHPLSDD
jgi:hypothetical protein